MKHKAYSPRYTTTQNMHYMEDGKYKTYMRERKKHQSPSITFPLLIHDIFSSSFPCVDCFLHVAILNSFKI